MNTCSWQQQQQQQQVVVVVVMVLGSAPEAVGGQTKRQESRMWPLTETLGGSGSGSNSRVAVGVVAGGAVGGVAVVVAGSGG
jgi:hypothetical protein